MMNACDFKTCMLNFLFADPRLAAYTEASLLLVNQPLSGEKAEQRRNIRSDHSVIYVGVENITILQDDRQQMVWACVRVRVRDKGKRGVLSSVEMRGKTNILHHVPSHTFPHCSLKAAASGVCQPHYHSVLAWGNYRPHCDTHTNCRRPHRNQQSHSQ